ncbi:MAG: hypothetical protein AB1298_01680 [Bacteroidota bacterium]
MFKSKIVLMVYGLLFSGIILFVFFEKRNEQPNTKPPLTENKVGEIVYSEDFMLKVLEVDSAPDGITRINLAVRNLTNRPVRFLVTARPDKSNDLGYRKYYFVVERNMKFFSTCCQHHLVKPCDDSGNSDYAFDIYFREIVTNSENCFLLVSEDPSGENEITKINLKTNLE